MHEHDALSAKAIIAVSGGVDSVVLLDMLARAEQLELVVAHIDHGIRVESGEDAQFVRILAAQYGCEYAETQLHLGPHASEETARTARWQFLRTLKTEQGAGSIITAHHADDVIETMIINLIRGTGWRGLASLRETQEIRRPLLAVPKQQILEYAAQHHLQWCEDQSNADPRYLRNYIRHQLVTRLDESARARLLALSRAQIVLREKIEIETRTLAGAFTRYELTMWPDAVAAEVLRARVGALPRPEMNRILLFVRTARAGKQLPLSNGLTLKVTPRELIVLEGQDC